MFEHEWEDSETKDKIVNMIKRLVKQGSNRVIYGRQTKIVEIDNTTSGEFLDKYHLQGKAQDSIRLGAMVGDELIGVMTLGVPRFNNKQDYEIIRLAWKSDVSVVGGVNKLFKHFIKKYNPSSVVTYCDISKFTGKVYTEIGFKVDTDGITTPNYVWVNPVGNKVISRYKSMKHKLIESGLGVYGNTEDEIMGNIGYLKIYNRGNLRLIWEAK